MKQKTIKTIELVNFLQHLVNEKKLLISNQSIVLAVSGGQDSICLFFIFLQLKTQWSWDFSLLYCNHLWQKDSFYTMSHLFKLAYLLNVRIYLTITLQKILTEQKARNWRFFTFQRITQFYLLSDIVTGHSKSDRIETGLFNVFRGSGTKGVTSLDWTKVVNKRCFFKLSQTELKNLKNLYQIKGNIDILYPWKKSKKQFCPPTELLPSHPLLVPTSYTVKESVKSDVGKSPTNISALTSLTKTLFMTPDISRGDVSSGVMNRVFVSDIRAKHKNNNSFQHFLLCAYILHCKRKCQKRCWQFATVTNLLPNVPYISYILHPLLRSPTNIIFDDVSMSGCQQQFALHKKEDVSMSTIKSKNCCPSEGSEKKERFVSIKCLPEGGVRSFKFVKVKKKEIEIFPLYTTQYTLIRPFLSLPRFDLKKLCTSWKIPLFPDQSNQEVKYQRNRIRKQLLPTLRFFFNPQIDTVLYQFIDIIKKEEEYINFITARIVRKIEQKQEKSVELETSLFGVLPIAVKRKVIQHFLDPIMKKSLTFFDVEKVLKQISIANIASCGKQIPFKDGRYQDAKSQKSFLKKEEKVNKKIFKDFLLSVKGQGIWGYPHNQHLSSTSPHKSKFRNIKVTPLTSPSNAKKEMAETGFAENLQTESLFIKGKLTEKHILRICFVSSLTSHIAKSSPPRVLPPKGFMKLGIWGYPHNQIKHLCEMSAMKKTQIKDVKTGSKADLFSNIETSPSHIVSLLPHLDTPDTDCPFRLLLTTLTEVSKEKICKPNIPNTPNTPKGVSGVPGMSGNVRGVRGKKDASASSPMVMSEGDVPSILQKDILFTLINKKKSIYKEYELMFFPKTGSLFLQSQRLFFMKNKQNL